MTKVLGQQQFSQLWNQFQTTNSHLFQDGGQLKSNLSTDDVQQLLSTVTQDAPDDSQLYGVHRLVTEHTDVFSNDDLELFRMEIDGLDLDFSRFAEDVAAAGLVNSAKRFANSARDRKEAFVIQSEPGHVWDLKSEEGVLEAMRAIVEQDRAMYPQAPLAEAVGRMNAGSEYVLRRYRFGNKELSFSGLLGRIRAARGLGAGDTKLLPSSAIVEDIKRCLGWVSPSMPVMTIVRPDGKVWDLTTERSVIEAVRQILLQDKERSSGTTLAEAAGSLAVDDAFRTRRYTFNDEALTMDDLMSRLRAARGYAADHRTAMPDAKLLDELRERFGGTSSPWPTVEVQLLEGFEFDLTSVDGVLAAIQLIITQDTQYYLGCTNVVAVGKIVSSTRCQHRLYRFGNDAVTMKTLLWSFYHARRYHVQESRPFSRTAMIAEIRELFGWKKEYAGTLPVQSSDGKPWDLETEHGVLEAIRAIIEQDKDRYPGVDIVDAASSMDVTTRYLLAPYSFAGETLRFRELLARLKRVSKEQGGRFGKLRQRSIVNEIKREFGVDVPKKKKPSKPVFKSGSTKPRPAMTIHAMQGEFWDLESEDGLYRAVRAIVEQDKERYSGNDLARAVAPMSTDAKYMQQYYRFEDLYISLKGLLSRVRRVRRFMYGESAASASDVTLMNRIKWSFGWEEPVPDAMIIRSASGHRWDLRSEEGIIRAIRGVVEQDKEVYPRAPVAEAVGVMSGAARYLLRRYCWGGEVLSLNALLTRLRKARGYDAMDTKGLPDSALVRDIRLRLGWQESESEAVTISAPPGAAWDLESESGIIEAIRLIVEQDKECYPENDVAVAVGAIRVSDPFMRRRYILGVHDLSLGQLLGRIRKARGTGASDFTTYPDGKLVQEVKESLGWQDPEDNFFEVAREGGGSWDLHTEAGVLEAFAAIFAQDTEVFPRGARGLKQGLRVIRRKYRFDGEQITTPTLFDRIRVARGHRSRDLKALSDFKIANDIKAHFGVAKVKVIEVPPDVAADLVSEASIMDAIRAIVEQDKDLYPGNSQAEAVGHMSHDERYLKTSYRIGTKNLSLKGLLQRMRKDRGVSGRLLPLPNLIDEIKRLLGWRDDESSALRIHLPEGVTADLNNEENLFRIIRAIVEQDKEVYPDEPVEIAVGVLATTPQFKQRTYRIGHKSASLDHLFGRIRSARGLQLSAKKKLPDKQIVDEIKERCGWKNPAFVVKATPDESWDLDTEEGLIAAIRAVVLQNKEHYPGRDLAESASHMKVGGEKANRHYVFGDYEITFASLLHRIAALRLKAGAIERQVRRSNIVRELQRQFGVAREVYEIKPRKVISRDEIGSYDIRSTSATWDFETEAGVFDALRAIVEQDKERYPGETLAEAVAHLKTNPIYLRRVYRFGDEEYMLKSLFAQIRKARGLDGDDRKGLSAGTLIREIKERFGWKAPRKEVFRVQGMPDSGWDLTTEEGVLEAIRTAITQDDERFPHDDISRDGGAKVFTLHRGKLQSYRFGDEVITPMGLFGRIRQARGLRAGDKDILSDADLVTLVRERLGFRAPPSDAFAIEAPDGHVWDLHSKEGIEDAIRAIALQDKERYPGETLAEAVRHMNTGTRFKVNYRFGEEEISLKGLFNRYRIALGYASEDVKALGYGAMAKMIQRLFGARPDDVIVRRDDGMAWDLTSKQGILEAARSALMQDQQRFSGDGFASALASLTNVQALIRYTYVFGNETASLYTLISRFRTACGYSIEGDDAMTMTEGLALFKKELGGLRYASDEERFDYAKREGLVPVLTLLAEAPSYVRDFLEIFCGDVFDDEVAVSMVRSFSALNLYTEIHQPRSPEGNLDILIKAMLTRLDRLADLSERDYARALRILSFVFGEAFDRNIDAAEHHVDELKARIADPTIKRLLGDLVAQYRAGMKFTANGLRTEPFIYQKLGAQFLVDNDRAILADETGLGKTLTALAAAEKLRERGEVKKVLIITPASVKSTWEAEIEKHLVPDATRKVVRIEGEREERLDLVQESYDAHYVITNYAFLRGKSPEELAPLLANVDIVIVDEAQNISSPSPNVLQAEAVRNIRVARRWLLTATPYYSRPADIFSLLSYLHPDRYADPTIFRKTFTTDIDGLRLLNGELEGVMLRRRLAETLGEYQLGVPLEAQGIRFPRKERIPPQDEGHYELSRGQVELLRELSQDIRGWMVRTGYAQKMHHFGHLRLMLSAVIDPKLLGEDIESPLYQELDRIVMKRLANGKKVLIYGHRRKLIDTIVARYSHLGAVQYNGKVRTTTRDKNLRAFETDPHTRILVSGIHSGGVGLNIKAADTVVYVERSFMYAAKVQSEGRPQRISVKRPKESYEVITLVGRYPEEFVAQEDDPSFRSFMEQGTVSEILEERLAGMDRIYRLVLDGFVSNRQAREEATKLMLQGFSGLTKTTLGDLDSAQKRKAAASAGAFHRLWHVRREDERMCAVIEKLARLYMGVDAQPGRLAEALEDVNGISVEAIEWLMTPFSESNKHLRNAAVRMLAPLIKSLGNAKHSLSDVAGGLASPSSKVAHVVLPLMTLFRPWESEIIAEIIKKLLAEIEPLSSHSRGQALTSLMVMSTSLGQSGNGRFRDFVLRHAHIFGDEDISIMRRTSALERLALFRELSAEGYEQIVEGTYDDIDALSRVLKERQWQTLVSEFGLEWDDETEAHIARLHGGWGDFRALMGLLSGLRNAGYEDELKQLKEVFSHIVVGDYRSWRNEQAGERKAGNVIGYLDDNPDFWKIWSAEEEVVFDELVIESSMQRNVLGEEYQHLLRLLQLTGSERIRKALQRFARADADERVEMIREVDVERRAAAEASDDVSRSALSDLTMLHTWLNVMLSLSSWSEGRNDTPLKLAQVINALRKHLLRLMDSDVESDRQLRAQIDRLIHFLSASRKEQSFQNVRIYDTDDPNVIMRMGALAPDMINCFNHHGNPAQNHVLVGALGSRNFRVVVVEVNGRMRAVAPVKIRKTDDERPAIFLERGLFSGRYNFEREMLEHLQSKAQRMDHKPLVARQVMKPQPGDITVYSTGSYSRNEYAEALFGVRESDAVYHSARAVFDPEDE